MRLLANRWGRAVALLALMGVLLHAQALVRHVVIVANPAASSSEAAALVADLTVLCHGSAAEAADTPDPVPNAPDHPTSKLSSCPVCAGLLSLHALPPPSLEVSFRHCRQAPARIARAETREAFARRLRPPGRAPPAITSV